MTLKQVFREKSKPISMLSEYKKGDIVTIVGVEMKVVSMFGSRWWLNNACDRNDVVFDKLGVDDPKKFVSSIVGYKVCDAPFPLVSCLEDLNKVISAMEQRAQDVIRPSTTEYKKGDIVTIVGVVMEVLSSPLGSWWLNNACGENGAVFEKLGVDDPKKFVSSIVGYKVRDAPFPIVSCLEDLNKVISALEQRARAQDVIRPLSDILRDLEKLNADFKRLNTQISYHLESLQ